MSDKAGVYDLGDIDATRTRRRATANEVTRNTVRDRPAERSKPVFAPVASPPGRTWPIGFALFLPGSGHLLQGERAQGLCFLASMACLGTLSWAIVVSLDRLWPTLEVLDVPPQASVWALAVLFVAAAAIHVGNVYAATTDLSTPGRGAASHPVAACAASLAVPGWGQAMTGHAALAALFLSGCWLTAGAWLLASPAVQALLDSRGLMLPAPVAVLTSPLFRWVLPAVLWTLATYDAALRASRN